MTATGAVREALPHWDLTPFFPGPESPELQAAMEELRSGIASLRELLEHHGISADNDVGAEAAAAAFDEMVEQLNAVIEHGTLVRGYLVGETSVDSRNEVAQARLSELLNELVALSTVETQITAWLGTVELDDLLARSQAARDHEYGLRRAQIQARHLMSEAEEELAAQLSLPGSVAWSRLHGDLTSQLLVSMELRGEERRLPMSELRNLASDRDREVRRAAHLAEVDAWEQAAVPLAAALNSVKGIVNTLASRRGWESPLDEALFGSALDRGTLDAMLEAVRESLPDFRRYFAAKARSLGLEKLAWYDLSAPAEDSGRSWGFEEARAFIVEQFGTYSERLAQYAERAFEERWIDAEPRSGKRDGAFCMPVRGDESRILANFAPTYRDVAILAHELGHGYHNINLASRTPLQRQTPMTLAETASIFCETIVRQGALSRAADSSAEQLEIVEGALETATGVTVDIFSRFQFETRLLERRALRELSVSELCELMLEAEREAYGEALEDDTLHPYMWAVKPHYYFTTYYNYPYTFGLLFGLGLYKRFDDDPDAFRAGYDDLLSSTGLADAATLAARFDIDIRSRDFWRSSLDVVRADIARYEQLTS